jgi:site-specific DNA recombinase
MPIIRDVIVKEFNEKPWALICQAAWNALLNQFQVFKAELDACRASFDPIDWISEALATAVEEFQCPHCSSSLLRNDNLAAKHAAELVLICSKCGEHAGHEDVVEAAIEESLAWEAHVAVKDGGDPPLEGCPECGRETFIVFENRCANCGFELEETSCGVCDAQAVIYARVSSKEQEKEGFSIPAQLKLLKEYASVNSFAVAQEYIDVETAKQTGRAAFGEMVAYLKAHPSVRVMLVEKTDRLYRNLKDWVTVDELDVERHFPKEGVVLSRESRSSEKFMHGIKAPMAKNYIDNLSEEARKGMQEKAEQGIWPTKTPLGYRNITGPDGKKIIIPDPALSPIVGRLFEWYAHGDISVKEAARKAHAAGLTYPKSGAKVPVSTVHTILRNRLYTGWFEWNGKLIQGKHEALVPVELWERVQGVLDGRFAKKGKRGRHDFAFSGLIACHACGYAVVGEIKKQRYVYYHCTGYADKCQGNPASCRRKYVREEALEAWSTELLGRLRFDDEVLGWVRDALHASHADERREHEEAIKRHQAEYNRLNDRIHAMYVDKLDGVVDTAFYDRMSNQWREEQNRCQREIERHQNADKSYLDEGVALLDLARNAERLFAKQEPRERRRLLNFVLSNCTWEDGEIIATFRQPFDVLAETDSAAAHVGAADKAKSVKTENWLGDLDSNQD